jgi:hypothetical protein
LFSGDIGKLLRRDTPLDIFKFNSEKWDAAIQEWGIYDTPGYQDCLNAFKAVTAEVQQYEPFSKWATYIMEHGQKKFPVEMKDAKMRYCPLGKKVIGGEFGPWLPDIFCTDMKKDVKDLDWNDGFMVFEFKWKSKAGNEDGVPTNSKGDSGTKRKQGSQTRLDNKKVKISEDGASGGGKLKFGSKSLAARNTTSKLIRSTSQPVPTVPGFNSKDALPDNNFLAIPKDSDPTDPLINHPLVTAKPSTNVEVQLANYAAQMMSAQCFRKWVVCALVDEDHLSLWYYDHSRAFCMKPIDFKDDHLSFIKIILALLLGSKLEWNLTSIPCCKWVAKLNQTSPFIWTVLNLRK